MLGYIWGAMLIVSLICSIYTGKMEELSSAALNGAAQAIELTLSLLGVMALWSGLMKIADKGGITAILAKVFSPFLRILFPDYKPKSPVLRQFVQIWRQIFLDLEMPQHPLELSQ